MTPPFVSLLIILFSVLPVPPRDTFSCLVNRKSFSSIIFWRRVFGRDIYVISNNGRFPRAGSCSHGTPVNVMNVYWLRCINILICKVNIWNIYCAEAIGFIFDSQTDVLKKVSKLFGHNLYRSRGTSSNWTQPECYFHSMSGCIRVFNDTGGGWRHRTPHDRYRDQAALAVLLYKNNGDRRDRVAR